MYAGDMPFISVTRLRLRSPWRLPGFIWHAVRSKMQAEKSPGHLSNGVLNDAHLAFWTRSVWKDEASMRAFLLSGAHKQAMAAFQEMVDEGAVAHWEQDSDTPPSWPEVHERILKQGRFSNVKHPSADHRARTFPPPRS